MASQSGGLNQFSKSAALHKLVQEGLSQVESLIASVFLGHSRMALFPPVNQVHWWAGTSGSAVPALLYLLKLKRLTAKIAKGAKRTEKILTPAL